MADQKVGKEGKRRGSLGRLKHIGGLQRRELKRLEMEARQEMNDRLRFAKQSIYG